MPHPDTPPSSSPEPLRILIAGAGIGGLFASIALATAGHKVTVYESSRFALETGAAIHLPPNVNALLHRFNLHASTFGGVTCEYLSQLKPDGTVAFRHDLRPFGKVYPYPWQLVHRIDLHNKLKETARGLGVVIELGRRVRGVDCDAGVLELEGKEGEVGEMVEGDLVVGGDGVHSVLRTSVLGHPSIPQPSGTSAFRFLIPIPTIASDPLTAHFVSRTGDLTMVYGDERRLVMYPCRENTELNFVAMIPDYVSGAQDGGWQQIGSKEVLLRLFEGWSEDVLALLGKAPEDTVKLWKLLDLDALPTWINGKVALIGDAAHPFTPHQGQGGAQAMEDGAALAALFPLGTLPSEIPERLKMYMSCRYERATVIQNYSRDCGLEIKGITRVKKEHMDPMQFTAFNFKHDAYGNALEALRKRDGSETSAA